MRIELEVEVPPRAVFPTIQENKLLSKKDFEVMKKIKIE